MTNPNNSSEMKKITRAEAERLKERVQASRDLSEKEKADLAGLLNFVFELYQKLEQAKFTLNKLKSWLGFKNERRGKGSKKKEEESTPEQSSKEADSTSQDKTTNQASSTTTKKQKPTWDETANHGRLNTEDYTGCDQIKIGFSEENPAICPDCQPDNQPGPTYKDKPREVVMLEASTVITGQRIVIDVERCAICNKRLIPEEAKDLPQGRVYKPSCHAGLAVYHYYAGLPFKRIEMLQAANGIPLPDATQYDLIADFYEGSIQPVYAELIRLGMQSHQFDFDDSKQRILTVTASNNTLPAGSKKVQVHASVILAYYQNYRIHLYFHLVGYKPSPLGGNVFSKPITSQNVMY